MASKYRQLNEPVFITRCELRGSKYGGDIWEIDLKTIRTKQDYKTYADPQNANWRTWEHIVQSAQDHGVVLSNLKVKDEEKSIVNADSTAKIEMVVLREVLAQELAQYWDKLDEEQDSYKRFYTEKKNEDRK